MQIVFRGTHAVVLGHTPEGPVVWVPEIVSVSLGAKPDQKDLEFASQVRGLSEQHRKERP